MANKENKSEFKITEFTEKEGTIRVYLTREEDYVVVNNLDSEVDIHIPVQKAETVSKMISELLSTLK